MRGTALLIAPPGSYRIAAYVEAARRLGVRLLVVSEGEHSLAAAGGLRVDFRRPEEALRTIRAAAAAADDADAAAHNAAAGREGSAGGGGGGFTAVVAPDDATVELAGRVASELGLVGNPPDAARLSRRKDLARARMAAAGVRVPEFRVLDLHTWPAPPPSSSSSSPLSPTSSSSPASPPSSPPSSPSSSPPLPSPLLAALAGVSFPCVVKPVAMSGSRGVIRADDAHALAAAIERVRAIAADAPEEEERSLLLVESFVPGPEVAVEGLLRDGRLEVLAVFDKPDPLDGPYFEESIYVTPSRLPPDAREAIVECVRQAAAACGLRAGPVHAELRWHDGKAWLLEAAARTIGGECAKLLRFGSGYGLEELVLAAAMGRDLPPGGLEMMDGAAGVMMLPTPRAGTLRRVEGVLAAREVPGVEEVSIAARVGAELTPLPEGSAYLGYVFARGEEPGEVERALREAAARLRVVIAPMWRLRPAA